MDLFKDPILSSVWLRARTCVHVLCVFAFHTLVDGGVLVLECFHPTKIIPDFFSTYPHCHAASCFWGQDVCMYRLSVHQICFSLIISMLLASLQRLLGSSANTTALDPWYPVSRSVLFLFLTVAFRILPRYSSVYALQISFVLTKSSNRSQARLAPMPFRQWAHDLWMFSDEAWTHLEQSMA